ncbi:MAG: protease inhibitor I42 family protein [Candidatus Omnitrophica bacterium]|nr:protease inhibitor I42 family protein [Candidatus Omnitrophota bacterium]
MMKITGFRLIILILPLALFTMAFAEGDFSREFKIIRLPQGKSMTIDLKSNPATGYSWRLAAISDKGVLEFLKKEFFPAEEKLLGAGGVEKWSFKTLKSGKATVVFEYAREWEKDAPPAKKEEFSIFVK